ncbi:MAG: glycosyltransferase family 2 protein [bacterium]|nr:glycosyltransferase family 2 protein [bacterium]
MLTNKKISIVTVCYNDGGCVREMYNRVTKAMGSISPNYEIIYVNDYSPDNALEVLRQLASEDKKVIVMSHSRNFGNQAAYTTGMRYSTGDAVITIDGDIQDPPELFGEFVKKWLEGYKVVYGQRTKRKSGFIRTTLYKIFYRTLQKMSYINIPLDAGDFALIDRKVLDIINNDFQEVNRYIRGMRAYAGFRSIGIPYTHTERFAGVSNFSFWGYVQWAKKMIFSFSYKPLEWISYIAGLVVVLTALAILAFIPLTILVPESRAYSITLVVLFLGAVQLLSLSAIAEYLAIIFEEVKRRPMGLVEEIINDYKAK